MAADCVVSPLGSTTLENYGNLRKDVSGIHLIDDRQLSPETFYGARMQDTIVDSSFTKFEYISALAIEKAIARMTIPLDRSLFILSTTKGNISFLEQGQPDHPRIHLHAAAAFLAQRFGFGKHLVISNACISGVLALIAGKRWIESGGYDHVVVVGADVLSRFVISGFQSLQALSSEPCRPFDAARKGINLGECAAAMVLTARPDVLGVKPSVSLIGGGLSNDANHISGPSRTGEELAFAIRQAMEEASLSAPEIDFISAHGTATLYNDEMEAKAFTLAALEHVPVNSMKGYFGHTLGAAGVLEVALSSQSLLHDELITSLGFKTPGVTQPINIIKAFESRPLEICLKTASGFGGCNAALILQKENTN